MQYLKYTLGVIIVLYIHSDCTAQQVTQLITGYDSYWKSDIGAVNTTVPNNSHNLLAFKYADIVYSTGVNDATLTANAINYSSGSFKALPFSSIGGTVTSSSATFISLGTQYDGVAGGGSTPAPSLRIRDVLTDGINGLNIGTGVTNVPNTALVTFPVTVSDVNGVTDSKPDVIFTQTAQPTGAGDVIYFQTAAGVLVGNQIPVAWTSIGSMGNQSIDLYTLNNVSCDLAVVNGFSAANQAKEVRMVAFKLSEFGITSTNASTVAKMIIKPGGQSDPAFIAYNTSLFSIPVPVITT